MARNEESTSRGLDNEGKRRENTVGIDIIEGGTTRGAGGGGGGGVGEGRVVGGSIQVRRGLFDREGVG